MITDRHMDDAPRIYFARAIDGLAADVTLALALRVGNELAEAGLQLVDPFAGEALELAASIGLEDRYRRIVEFDLAVLRSCDAVLMDMSLPNRNYIGCSCELVYAFIWDIPCVVYLGTNDRRRPWLAYHASGVFEARRDAIARLTQILMSR